MPKVSIVIPVYNPSDKETITVTVEISQDLIAGKTVSSEHPFICLEDGKYRLRLEADATACLILK